MYIYTFTHVDDSKKEIHIEQHNKDQYHAREKIWGFKVAPSSKKNWGYITRKAKKLGYKLSNCEEVKEDGKRKDTSLRKQGNNTVICDCM